MLAADFADYGDWDNEDDAEVVRIMKTDVSRDPRTYAIIGAAMEVHRELGCGFLEAVYQETLSRELVLRGVPHIAQPSLRITYKGEELSSTYRPDFICFGSVIVELKASSAPHAADEAQVIHYLKATGIETGLLINFGMRSLQYRRFILTTHQDALSDPAGHADLLEESPDWQKQKTSRESAKSVAKIDAAKVHTAEPEDTLNRQAQKIESRESAKSVAKDSRAHFASGETGSMSS